jgi:hypothetical protein
MADFSACSSHFESNNIPHFTIHPKSQMPVESVIQHLPVSSLVEDISEGFVNL